jgi:molecular chaperone HtpG
MPTLKIHTENILPIIKKWLYSDRDIFVRELVSNACDALHKIKIIDSESGQIEHRIDIAIDKEKRTLTFVDTGLGMTSEEVEKYIAQIAFSGAEEFLGKYQSNNEKDQIIGHFGLGFYSAYMVAEKVTIDTLSYQQGAEPAFWACDGSSEYQLEKGQRSVRGTEITLYIDKENEEFLEEARLKKILDQYCAFLPFPISLNGKRINDTEPLWIKAPSECTENDYLEFYRKLYPMEQDPIFWVHLNVDYPFHLKGILYFPKITRRFDWAQSQIKLFCNRVFVSDHCKDIVPDYLMALRGALDSPDIPLNVSRSYLQMDRTVRQLSSHISKKVADRLCTLYETERETFINAWSDVEVIIKLGILQDEKFYERAKEFLIWKNLKAEWTTLEQYAELHKEAYQNKVFYTSDDKLSAPFLDLYKNKGIEILIANTHVDTALMNYLENKLSPITFQRVDGKVDDAILDTSRENTQLDDDGKTEGVKIADFFRSQLAEQSVEVEAKSLASDSLPAFIVIDENMRRMRDYLALSQQSLPGAFGDKQTFVVNTNSKLIHTIYGLKDKSPELAKEMTTHVYELSLLSQKELEPGRLSAFVERSTAVLEKLAQNLS